VQPRRSYGHGSSKSLQQAKSGQPVGWARLQYIPIKHMFSSSEGGVLRAKLPIAAEDFPRERPPICCWNHTAIPPATLLQLIDFVSAMHLAAFTHTGYGHSQVPTAASCVVCATRHLRGRCGRRRKARDVALEAQIGMACSSKVRSESASGPSRGVLLFGCVNGAMYWSRCGSKLQLACQSFQGPALFADGTGTRSSKDLLIGEVAGEVHRHEG
jgi:hypothetical protein